MEVGVNITGAAPRFVVTYPSGPYTVPLSVKFTNNSTTDDCWVWYRADGMSPAYSYAIGMNGGFFTVQSGVSFNVSAPNVTVQPALSHVIHVGSGRQ